LPVSFIDISVPLVSGMLNWPGDPPVHITRILDQAAGDDATVSRLDMGAHTGTHMDAPLHFIDGAAGIESMPLDAVIGTCRVIELDDEMRVDRESLARHAPGKGERILLKTRNSRHHWWKRPFNEDFVYIAAEAADYLASCTISTIGIDYLSVGGYRHDGVETHRALLEAGIWVIEGLDLTRVRPGNYTLICLPLKILGGDGAPARAILTAA
jgi:arylformamidase